MVYTIEYEQEEDGRWLAEVMELPGVLADKLEHGEGVREMVSITFAAA